MDRLEGIKNSLELELIDYKGNSNLLYFKASELLRLSDHYWDWVKITATPTSYVLQIEDDNEEVIFNREYGRNTDPREILLNILDVFINMVGDQSLKEAGPTRKDYERMNDLVISRKDGATIARSIKDKEKAVNRWVAGNQIVGKESFDDAWQGAAFISFRRKAIELGATEDDFREAWDSSSPDFNKDIYDKARKESQYSGYLKLITAKLVARGYKAKEYMYDRGGSNWELKYYVTSPTGEELMLRFHRGDKPITNHVSWIYDYFNGSKSNREFVWDGKRGTLLRAVLDYFR